MLKRLIDKRVNMFKEAFPDYQTSESGNIYIKIDENEFTHQVYFGGHNTTKNQLEKIGTTTKYTKKDSMYIFMISPLGKLMIKRQSGWRFKTFTLKDLVLILNNSSNNRLNHEKCIMLVSKLANIFFIGRKFDYMKDEPDLWKYKIFQNCSSIKEAKMAIRLSSISNKKFISLFGSNILDIVYILYLAINKANVVNLLTNIGDSKYENLLNDYINFFPLGTKLNFPRGVNKLRKLHDAIVEERNKEALKNYSKEIKYKGNTEHISDYFNKNGLKARKLESPYDMFEEGIKLSHCIGTNYIIYLDIMSFFSLSYDDNNYTIAIKNDGTITQFQGYKNYYKPPIELTDIVNKPGAIFYRHRIKEISVKGKYPKVKELYNEEDLAF